jgi:formamidopyrimidine-DNA glycosylase
MPELPDVVVYVQSLERLLLGASVLSIHVRSPFVLRTFQPSFDSITNAKIIGFSRRGKRIVWHLEGERFLLFHLMIAGRFHWHQGNKLPTAKIDLLSIVTDRGTMKLTEASSKKRAGLWIFSSIDEVNRTDPGGLDVLSSTVHAFETRLLMENRTLKRALADPRLFDGIGNAYSDEILHAARLSPLKRTQQLSPEEIERLFDATRKTLQYWIAKLAAETKTFPERVTAFRDDMAVHGKFQQPCPDCGAPVQRIRYAENECNYCAKCQTAGKLLADRSLSRLLKDDWPKSLDELDEMK